MVTWPSVYSVHCLNWIPWLVGHVDSLGSFDSLDILDLWISWHDESLDSMDLLTRWISWLDRSLHSGITRQIESLNSLHFLTISIPDASAGLDSMYLQNIMGASRSSRTRQRNLVGLRDDVQNTAMLPGTRAPTTPKERDIPWTLFCDSRLCVACRSPR